MEILHIAVPAAVLLVIFALIIFWWAVKHGQFDDLERQGMNILLDEEPQQRQSQSNADSADKNLTNKDPDDKSPHAKS